MTGVSVWCRHPTSPRHLFLLSSSERHPEGEPAKADEALRAETEGVLRSVAFSAFPAASLPPDTRVLLPGPGVPPDRARFSGTWVGLLDNGVEHALQVEDVRGDEAVVVVSVGLLGRGAAWQRLTGVFRHGRLVLATGEGTMTYQFLPEGALLATATRGGETLQGTLTRREP
jgi:hypothetical protein